MTKQPGGRPTKYDKDFHPDSFIELSDQGKCLAQIARSWRVSRDTLYEWAQKHPKFADAVKMGREYSEAWYMDLGQSAISGLEPDMNNGMFVWMTKNMFRWSDKIEVDEKVQLQTTPLKELTDQQLDNLHLKELTDQELDKILK